MAAPTVSLSTISDSKQTVTRKITIPTGGDADLTTTLVVDISAFTTGATGTECSIKRIDWSLDGFSADLLFDADTDVVAVTLAAGTGHMDFSNIGPNAGLPNNSGAGKTGDILLATHGIGTGDAGFILLTVTKVV